ncbi:winged helix-turn-helix transcriptional regulator [Bosea sp. MMO-172]|uniref:winged helix-turn-helix transcriptional regulator n=1 Tax=Bosea sp. MMO-172 TaxID=3127885 RepID=UPI003017F54B
MSEFDDFLRRFVFVSSVQALVLAELSKGDIPKHIVTDLMLTIDRALRMADEIPADMGPAMAAYDLMTHTMMMYAEDREVPGYEKPHWLPDPPPSEPSEGIGPTEWFIDGTWVIADPRWDGLPGESILELNIAALLREQGALRPNEIAEHLKVSESGVLTALHALRQSRDVRVSGRPAHWSLSQSVLDNLALAELREPKAKPETDAPLTIRTRIILALQSRPRQRYHELAAAVSLSETYIRKHLHDMAQEGLVKASKRPARWSLVKPESEKRPPKFKPPQEHASEVEPAALIEAAKPAAARRPRRELPKGLGKPLNIRIVNEIVAELQAQPAQRYFTISVGLSIRDDLIRRYLHDLEVLGVVVRVDKSPMRWSLAADWSGALDQVLGTIVADASEPRRLSTRRA